MAELIEMPKLSDTMEEGGIATWLKEKGDFIEEGEAFVEIETDKATMEYNSPVEGHLLEILVGPGQSCDLGAPIAVVGAAGEKVDLAELQTAAKPTNSPSAEDGPKSADQQSVNGSGMPAVAESPRSEDGVSRIKASPLAKKVASEKRLDLAAIVGSGPHGRIIFRDVAGLSTGVSSNDQQGSTHAESYAPVKGPTGEAESVRIPNSMMRKTIAKRLLAGKNEAPHFYLNVTVVMDQLLQWRKQLNDGLTPDDKLEKVSVNDLLVLACSRALTQHPEVNASWTDDAIVQHNRVHLAVAVALPDGLITPVVRDAHLKGARDIAVNSKQLVRAARDGQLQPQDYQGGTFTISNLGMMGIDHFTAIINPPQAAILAVGATTKAVAVDEKDQFVVQQQMKMTLSCDHRVVDGAVGAGFLQTLVAYLENPLLMLS